LWIKQLDIKQTYPVKTIFFNIRVFNVMDSPALELLAAEIMVAVFMD